MLFSLLTTTLVTAGGLAVGYALYKINASTETGTWSIGNLQVDDVLAGAGLTGAVLLSGPFAIGAAILGTGALLSGMLRRGSFPSLEKIFSGEQKLLTSAPTEEALATTETVEAVQGRRYVVL